MLTFEYTAIDPATGKQITSEVAADSPKMASKLIVEQGYAPIDIRIKGKKTGFSFKKKIGAKDRVLFSRQMSTLINAGMPLTQSLRTVTEQMQNKDFVEVIHKIITDIESGSSLAKALAKHPNVFNNVYISLITAGESSGTLDEALERLATQQEKDADVVSKVRGALIYPALVITVVILVVVFMMITVLPQVEQLYLDLDKQLPFVTAILLGASRFMRGFWWLIIIILIGIAWALKQYAKTPSGRAAIDHFKMHVPLFGKLFMKLYMARFTRTAQTLMTSGVPLLETITISARSINNVHIANALMASQIQIKAGKTLSQAIEGNPNFLPLVTQMLHIGEESGSLDKMLNKAATYYENEVDNQIKSISTIIEPVLMIFLALIVGVLVVAILIPIYGLVGANLGG